MCVCVFSGTRAYNPARPPAPHSPTPSPEGAPSARVPHRSRPRWGGRNPPATPACPPRGAKGESLGPKEHKKAGGRKGANFNRHSSLTESVRLGLLVEVCWALILRRPALCREI